MESEQAHGKGKYAHLSLPSAQKGRWDETIAPPLSIEEEMKRNSMGGHFCFRKEKEASSGTIHYSSYAEVSFMHTATGSGSLEPGISFVTPKIEIIQQVFMCEFRSIKTHSFLGKIRFVCLLIIFSSLK